MAAAAYIFLMQPDDIQKAIFMGVSDTIASIAGALVGARNDLSKIPQAWVAVVEDSEIMQDLAHQLVCSITAKKL